MRQDLERITTLLLRASEGVPQDYFQLPVVDREEPQYRERVYCYELYHQWRVRWPNDIRYSLCGEIDKHGHPIVRGDHKPDFLVHKPGAHQNLLIMEVKPFNASVDRMVADLKKLTKFLRGWSKGAEPPRGDYYAAYFWLYGQPESQWPELQRALRGHADARDVDFASLACYLHCSAGFQARRMQWE